jgi:hypothetical protein
VTARPVLIDLRRGPWDLSVTRCYEVAQSYPVTTPGFASWNLSTSMYGSGLRDETWCIDLGNVLLNRSAPRGNSWSQSCKLSQYCPPWY